MPVISFREFGERFTAALQELIPATAVIIAENPEGIIKGVQEQLHVGEDANHSKLKRYKNKRYADKKFKQNPSAGYGTPDFYLTGETYRTMGVASEGDSYAVFAQTPYFNKLVDRDKNSMDMNPENKRRYKFVTVFPKLRISLYDNLGIKKP